MNKFAALTGLFFFCQILNAQDSLRFVSATTGAACYQVEYYNNYLFAGTGTTLRVYDVNGTPPYNMLFEYRFRSVILDLKVKNNFLYVAANHDGISKWDITTISNPVKLYEYVPDSLNEAAHDIAFYGDTLFIAYYKKVGVFYDNGTSFQKLATFGHLAGNGYIAGGDVKDTIYAYTVARNCNLPNPDGIYFYNTQTLSPITFYQQNFAGPEDVIFGKNTPLLHVLGGTHSTCTFGIDPRGYFYTLDISGIGVNPPSLVFSDTLPGFPFGLAIASPMNAVNINDTIYVATQAALTTGSWTDLDSAQIYVYDATNPSNVNLITRIYAGLWHFDCDVNNNTLYVASEWYGVKALDISNIFNEADFGNTLTGGWAMKGDKYGNTLVLANEGYGFKKFDISNISQPALSGAATYTANAPGFCQEVKFSSNGNYIYGLFMTDEQFRIYDANTLSLVGDIPNIGGVGYGNTDMLVWGNRVFVDSNGGSTDSLRVIDASVPTAPFIDTTLTIDVNDMKMYNGKIFLCNDSGIYVYDVTSGVPVYLTKKLFTQSAHNGKQIVVITDTIFAYVTSKGLVRYLYNSTLNTITEDLTVTAPMNNGNPQAMAVDAFGLYLAWTKFGLYAYDKQTMIQTSWYRTGLDLKGYADIWPVTDLFCKDGYIFLNEYFGQTTILTMDSSLVTSNYFSEVESNSNDILIYPNPTSGNLRITNLSEFTNYELEIYNVMGEKIYSAADFQINTSSNFQIDLSDSPGGIYFLQFISDKLFDTKKLEIIK